MYSLHEIVFVLLKSIAGDSGTKKTIVYLAVIPLAIGAISLILQYEVHSGFLEVTIVSMTLLVGFSMNAVILMLRYAENTDSDRQLVAQVRNIAVYLVTLGISILIAAIVGIAFLENSSSEAVRTTISSIYFIIITHFFMVCLLFPARIFVIIERLKSRKKDDNGNGERIQVEEVGP
ncbi:hypothetical protein [Natronococcus sp. A-GB7]|uniref:MFS transporter n=1 Tax=Natronococcus sp. A-GB7 TaxID=3037649 RepID=UPI00241C8C19|nr:hypothetical protein [Natronococcus sp. A-GB7]MDG5821638.1 hypothetical protein [Natronococcus sp. A-GB7]